MTDGWRKTCIVRISTVCTLQTKSRRKRWGRHEARTKFQLGGVKERDHTEDTGTDGQIMLKLFFRNR
jgi:hypothetical protein